MLRVSTSPTAARAAGAHLHATSQAKLPSLHKAPHWATSEHCQVRPLGAGLWAAGAVPTPESHHTCPTADAVAENMLLWKHPEPIPSAFELSSSSASAGGGCPRGGYLSTHSLSLSLSQLRAKRDFMKVLNLLQTYVSSSGLLIEEVRQHDNASYLNRQPNLHRLPFIISYLKGMICKPHPNKDIKGLLARTLIFPS